MSDSPRKLAVLLRTPFTALVVLALLVVGIVSGSFLVPASEQPWFERVATGLPAFTDGRWYTIATSPWFFDRPWVFLTLLPLVAGGLGWAEWRFGTLRAVGLFVVGHVVGVLGAASLLSLISRGDWHWAVKLSETLDLGPSCGALFALVFAIATLPAPWRLRARLAVGLWVGISVLYLGMLYDLEHAIATAVALVVSGLLPAFRRPAERATQREWRLIAMTALIAIGVIEVIELVIPYDGPLGENHPVASVIDVAVDIVFIALIADGIRRGIRLAWVVALIAGGYNIVTSLLAIGLIPMLIEYDIIEKPAEVLGIAIAPTTLWIGLMVLLIIGRHAFRVPLRRRNRQLQAAPLDQEGMAERVRQHGGGTISWMTTWTDNSWVSSGDAALAYQAHAGVAILLGDPIAAEGDHARALEQFEHVSQQTGLIPCAFSVSEAVAEHRPKGWRAVVVAEDTIVDLPGLEFKGKPWAHVRTALNKAEREGVRFRLVKLAEEPWNVLAQVRAISEQWTGEKGLPEMRFTLGTVEEALDPEVLLGIAVDDEGNLHGVTSWLPVYGGDGRITGWTLDLMRRRDGGFGPVMEFLIGSSAMEFSQRGYEFLSLSGAPLVRPADLTPGPIDQILATIANLIEPLYGFASLHRFKQKFNPRHASMYLLYRDEGDLPRIGVAITKAYLPDASLRDLIASAAPATGSTEK